METATLTQWERFCADAWTDDWADLCDRLGIDYTHELEHNDLNSRQLRKRVNAWADDHGWARVYDALRRLS